MLNQQKEFERLPLSTTTYVNYLKAIDYHSKYGFVIVVVAVSPICVSFSTAPISDCSNNLSGIFVYQAKCDLQFCIVLYSSRGHFNSMHHHLFTLILSFSAQLFLENRQNGLSVVVFNFPVVIQNLLIFL